MGTTKKKNNRARESNDDRLRQMLEDAYVIGSNAMGQARELTEAGQFKGISQWMFVAEKAIGEIVRLGTLTNGDKHENHYTIEFLEPPDAKS
jgi:hypothetical protein